MNKKQLDRKPAVWLICFCLMAFCLTACSGDGGNGKNSFDDSEYGRYVGIWEQSSVEIDGYEMSGEDLPRLNYIIFEENGTASVYTHEKNDLAVCQVALHARVTCDEKGKPQEFSFKGTNSYVIGGIEYDGTMTVYTYFTNDDGSEGATAETYAKISNETQPSAITQKKDTGNATKKKVVDEFELKDIARKEIGSEWIFWYYDDFNYDGDGEAFVVYGEQDEEEFDYRNVSIWFLNSSGEYQQVAKHNFMNTFSVEILKNERKFLTCEMFGGSGSVSYIYSVSKDGKSYEPKISGTVQEFRIRDAGPYYTEDDWSAGYHEYVDKPLNYDRKTGEFKK